MLSYHKNESILGQTKLRLGVVDSTNNYAANLLKEGLICHGTVILADEQTNGRGQRGTLWQSASGQNLTFSLVILPNQLNVSHQKRINEFVSLSIVSFLEYWGLKAHIKWPNDIYVGDKKIAGILIENQLKSDQIVSSVIGIGLNVNQMDFNSLPATSMQLETKRAFLLNDALDSLLFRLNEWYKKLEESDFDTMEENYLNHLLGYKKWRSYIDPEGHQFEGKIEGVSPEGLLVVGNSEGEMKKYDVKEVQFLF